MKRLILLGLLAWTFLATFPIQAAEIKSTTLSINGKDELLLRRFSLDRVLTYQGLLKNSSGNPVPDASYNLTFRIYNRASGGTALWTSSSTSVTTASGYFTTQFGPVSLPFDTTYYLSLQIQSDPEMTTRQRLTISPSSASSDTSNYAFKADTANYALNGGGGGGGWTDDGTRIRLTTISDSVGIGITTPTAKLQVQGTLKVTDKANIGLSNTNNGTRSFVAGDSNSAQGNYSSVTGGHRNNATGINSVLGGGWNNQATGYQGVVCGGYENTNQGTNSSIAGGQYNFIGSSDPGIDFLGGGSADSIINGNYSALCGGENNKIGDYYCFLGGGNGNSVKGAYSTIGGGEANSVRAISGSAFIGGGTLNVIDSSGFNDVICGGEYNTTGNLHSFIGGGYSNSANGDYSMVGGGNADSASNMYATICGGYNNNASGGSSTIGGGGNNKANGDIATVSGGNSNKASGYSSTVGGGWADTASNVNATVGGGDANMASGADATVGGGEHNTASGGFSAVGGGVYNKANGLYTTVSGGVSNTAGGGYSTVGGGFADTATSFLGGVSSGYFNRAGSASTDTGAFVSGGVNNHALGKYSTITGGLNNLANSPNTTIGGGGQDTASNNWATISGGSHNVASGWGSMIPGGAENIAGGTYDFAAGIGAHATHNGCFIWADDAGGSYNSDRGQEAKFRLGGGVRFDINGLAHWVEIWNNGSGRLINTSVGAFLSTAGVWTNNSDRNLKENFTPIDGNELLSKISQLSITRWNYKSDDKSITHIGPMAQDFKRLFEVGNDSTTISSLDPSGVALAGIQELLKQNKEMMNEIGELKSENAQLRKDINDLKSQTK